MTRFLADYALAALVAEDRFGTLHRAVRVDQGRHQRHALLRRFPENAASELADRLGEAIQLSTHLGDVRGLMPRCRIHRGPEPFVSYDYLPGRTLAQVLRAGREQHLPLGLEHTLTLLRDLSRALDQLHERGLERGLLVPELVWITFEGGVLWLDVPLMPLYRGPQRSGGSKAGWQEDLRGLALLGWQMLTGEPQVPAGAEALTDGLVDWSKRSGQPLGPRLVRLFRRMAGVDEPFPSREAFHAEAGEMLHAEEEGPSTFSLSFYMHTLFRDAVAVEERAMAQERIAEYGKPLPPQDPAPMIVPKRRGLRPAWALGAGSLVLAGAAGWFLLGRGENESERLRRALAESQRRQSELEAKDADLARKAALPPPPPAAPEPPPMQPAAPEPVRETVEKPKVAELLKPPPGGQAPAALLHLDPPRAPGGPAKVRLQVYLGEDGRALRAMPMEAAAPALAEAAKAAALKASYRPAWRDGRRVRDWLEVVVPCR